MRLAIALAEATNEQEVGGKARNLARLIALGAPVPAGVVLTRAAFDRFVADNGLTDRLERLTRALDPGDPERFGRTAQAIRTLVMTATLPAAIQRELNTIAERVPVQRVVAVRSSAIGEDGARASFAGQFDSILGVKSEAELGHALLACWASCWSSRALFYRAARRLPSSGMGVIVEQQVAARISGVLFTRAPEGLRGAAADDLVIEYCAGLGDALVSGHIDPYRLVVSRATLTVQNTTSPDTGSAGDDGATLAPEHVVELSRLSLRLEAELAAPQDIEWSIDEDGVIWILQARPITTSTGGGASRTPDALWSNANVNENFPRPISPLLYSIAEAGYYHYFRNLGLAFGISRARLRAMDRRLAGIIGVHGARMYYNLTNIHAVLRMAPFGERLAAAFNQFVGVDETAAQPLDASSWHEHRGRLTQAGELLRIAAQTTWQFLFLRGRVRSFERTADRFAARVAARGESQASPGPGWQEGPTLGALVDDLHEFLEIRCHRWKNASLADTAAMLSYALLQRALAGEGDPALHNRLLRGLPGVPSTIQPLRLWALSRIIRSDSSLSRLFTSEAADVLGALRHDGRFAPFRREFDRFLDDWGFRSSAELMLAEPSLQEDPRPVIELLKGYAAMEGEPPERAIARQSADRRAETWRVLRGLATRSPLRAVAVAFLLHRTQRAVVYRERVRLKQALLYTRCRNVALAIGDDLVRRSVMPHRDAVFMLTVQELSDLAAGRSMFPYHVADLIALRRRDRDQLAAMRPPDTVRLPEGVYLRPEISDLSQPADADTARFESTEPNDETTIVGTSAGGGSITAPAAVLTDVREAHQLCRGDVLVTRQTDPGWAPVFCLISGLVIERGGMLSHGAIIAREFGLPCVVGIKDATRRIGHGTMVTVDGDRGTCTIAAQMGS
jgi:phosphohistidine swiveling domain-containing protein